MSTVLDALQELIDRRAMQSVHDSGARGHAAIEAARWRETQQLIECMEELMNTAQGKSGSAKDVG